MITAILIAIIVSVFLTIDFNPTIEEWNQQNQNQKSISSSHLLSQ
jgi:hypothetical protein